MIKKRVRQLIDQCFTEGVARGFWSTAAEGSYSVEEPKHAGQGDLATNLAMVVAGKERKNPRDIAVRFAELLGAHGDLLAQVEIAGPGFVNLVINREVWQLVLPEICHGGAEFGSSVIGRDKKVMVEFVSANPTGPLSVGHGRQAVLGDAIARLLIVTGHNVTREYYYNDAGRQMRVLGESARARYLEALGLPFSFPEDGYQGEYIREIARALVAEKGDTLKDEVDVVAFKTKAEQVIFSDIKATLKRLDIVFDSYYNEHSLYEEGLVDDVVSTLRAKGLAYDKDDAVWFRSTEFGLPQDRVIIKSSGEPTYRLPDMAYHREKFRRGFDWMVDIFGSDHIATMPDVLAGVKALGYDPAKVTVVLHQFVTLLRDGQQVKMSTRKANFVTVDELLDEVGPDAARFFFLMRKADSQLEFDLALATRTSQENPVYYVQYGHARLASIARQAEARGIVPGDPATAVLNRLVLDEEIALLKAMAGYPGLVEGAALDLAPHRIVFYLQDLAAQFHSYYNKVRILSEDEELSRARLLLAAAVKIVIANGLTLIGVNAPETM